MTCEPTRHGETAISYPWLLNRLTDTEKHWFPKSSWLHKLVKQFTNHNLWFLTYGSSKAATQRLIQSLILWKAHTNLQFVIIIMIKIMTTMIIKCFEASFKASPEIQKQNKYRLESFVQLMACRKWILTTNLVQG